MTVQSLSLGGRLYQSETNLRHRKCTLFPRSGQSRKTLASNDGLRLNWNKSTEKASTNARGKINKETWKAARVRAMMLFFMENFFYSRKLVPC